MIDEIFDLPVPHRMNQKIINYLGEQAWSYVSDCDEKYKNPFYDIVSNPLLKDAGQAIVSYRKSGDFINNNTLNFFGDYIFSLIQERSNFKIKDVSRFYWNLYTPQSVCQDHSDEHNVGRFISAIYNLHTNDGGTQVENQFVTSKESQVILFKSEKIHKGISSKTSNFRLNLNIIMEL
jgi:hypothetical protein